VTLVRNSPDRKAVRKPEILVDIHGFCQSTEARSVKKNLLAAEPFRVRASQLAEPGGRPRFVTGRSERTKRERSGEIALPPAVSCGVARRMAGLAVPLL
jgi:hypothetical protein